MAIIKKGKKEKNDKINEIRKRKLPIIKFEKGEVSWRLARVPHRDRVCVCVCNTRTLHFESEEKKKVSIFCRYTSFKLSISRSLSPLRLVDATVSET